MRSKWIFYKGDAVIGVRIDYEKGLLKIGGPSRFADDMVELAHLFGVGKLKEEKIYGYRIWRVYIVGAPLLAATGWTYTSVRRFGRLIH